jgi:hypothetical protein
MTGEKEKKGQVETKDPYIGLALSQWNRAPRSILECVDPEYP